MSTSDFESRLQLLRDRYTASLAHKRIALTEAWRRSRPIRAIFIGRAVPYKGADMLLDASAALIKSGAMTLEIVGDGPQLPQLREQAKALGLSPSGITFTGWIAHSKIQERLVEADLLTFPSIREFGGGVALALHQHQAHPAPWVPVRKMRPVWRVRLSASW